MTRKSRTPIYRVFANDEGQVFLRREPPGIDVFVERPVTLKKLEQARADAIELRNKKEDKEKAEKAKKTKATNPERAKAQNEIEEVLHPTRISSKLDKAAHVVWSCNIRLFTFLLSLVALSFLYKGIQYSSEHLPDSIHGVVLFLYLLSLGLALYVIGTEENRSKYRKHVVAFLGRDGMLVLPCLLLVTAGAVLASITFKLYNRGFVALDMCSGRPVNEAGLLDFYIWHFVNIIPTMQVTKLWRWGEPYCYTQSRVGIIIFLFQLLVVIPSFNTIRFYWKHRHTPGFIHDPEWKPELVVDAYP